MKADWGVLNFIGGYQTYEAVHDDDTDQTIASWVAGIQRKVNFGPAYLGVSVTYRQNGDNYGAWTKVHERSQRMMVMIYKMPRHMGGVAALGWKINDSNTLEGSLVHKIRT